MVGQTYENWESSGYFFPNAGRRYCIEILEFSSEFDEAFDLRQRAYRDLQVTLELAGSAERVDFYDVGCD